MVSRWPGLSRVYASTWQISQGNRPVHSHTLTTRIQAVQPFTKDSNSMLLANVYIGSTDVLIKLLPFITANLLVPLPLALLHEVNKRSPCLVSSHGDQTHWCLKEWR